MTRPGIDSRRGGPPAGSGGVSRRCRSSPGGRPGFVTVAALLVVAYTVAACGDSSTSNKASGTKSKNREQAPVRVEGRPLPRFGAADKDPAIGRRAPVLVGTDLAGRPMRIGPGTQPKLVLFVAHWCPHCRREVPLLSKWIAGGKAPKGVDIVTVATGTNPNSPNYPPSRWLQREKWTPPVMADSSSDDAAGAFGLDAYPFFTLLRADGTVVARASGEVSVGDLSKALQKLVSTNGKP